MGKQAAARIIKKVKGLGFTGDQRVWRKPKFLMADKERPVCTLKTSYREN